MSSHANEPATIKIGSASAFASGGREGKHGRERKGRGNELIKDRKPAVLVEVYLWNPGHGTDVLITNTMTLGLLRRFSGVARKEFPKVNTPEQIEAAAAISKNQDDVADWVEVAAETYTLGFNDQKRSRSPWSGQVSPKTIPTKPASSGGNASSEPKAEATEQLKRLFVWVNNVNFQPSVKALQDVIHWMDENKHTGFKDKLEPFGIPNMRPVSLDKLVDFYAASLALDLVPHPMKLRKEILDRLTDSPPSAHIIEMVTARIPYNDGVIKRLLTSYYDHKDAGEHTREGIAAVEHFYTVTDPIWKGTFRYMQNSRRKEQDQARREQQAHIAREDRQRRWTEGVEGVSADPLLESAMASPPQRTPQRRTAPGAEYADGTIAGQGGRSSRRDRG